MSTKISEQSFNQIKDVRQALTKEISYDKRHSNQFFNWIAEDVDFKHFYNPLVSGITVAKEIAENLDLSIATDLTAKHLNDAIYITYSEDTPTQDSGLNVAQVCNIINKVLKLGRQGIEARDNKLGSLGKRLASNEAQLRLPYDEKYDSQQAKDINNKMNQHLRIDTELMWLNHYIEKHNSQGLSTKETSKVIARIHKISQNLDNY